MGASNVTVPEVCFSQCGPCSAPINLTLLVDMSQQTIAATGVYVGGTFNGWSSNTTAMTNSGNGIYTATVSVNGGSVQEYKYINGDTWADVEIVPSACGVPDGSGGFNRQVATGTINMTVDTVCFGQCTRCAPRVNLTLQVDMSLQTIGTSGVHVGGSFNNWSDTATAMTTAGNNVYTVTIPVYADSIIEYKFINGDTWANNEIVPSSCGVPDGSGGYNRQIAAGSANLTAPVVCFSECGPCPLPVNLTLSVDMSQQTIDAAGIHVGGTFNSWSSSATAMTTIGNNIYTAIVAVSPGSVHEYKFINGDTWAGKEFVPAACGVPDGAGGNNRQVTLGSANLTTDLVCFSQCGPCGAPLNTTFRIDMSLQTVSADGVHIAGNFQGWDPATSEMTLTGNGIYEYTTQFLSAGNIEYRFINGIAWAGEESVPEACGVPNGSGGFNRFFTMPANDTILPVKCFSSCEPCPVNYPVNVTFTVDMTYATISPDGVHLAGTFQGWDPAATPMTDMGNNIYSKTVLIDTGVQAQYKFINGIAWADAEPVPEACGVPDGQSGFNRFISVPGADTSLALVCFSLCSVCPVGVKTTSGVSGFSIYPNPATDILNLSFNAKTASGIVAELYNTDGKKVYSFHHEIPNSGQNTLTLSPGHLPKGIYYLILRAGNDNAELITRKVIFR
jgi:hypothetical protein